MIVADSSRHMGTWSNLAIFWHAPKHPDYDSYTTLRFSRKHLIMNSPTILVRNSREFSKTAITSRVTLVLPQGS